MSYIGKSPAVGNFVKLDAITTSSTNTYNLTVDSVAFVPESANHMLVSLNGVIQAPLSSFSVSGSTITFIPASGTLSSSDSIDFIMVYGNVLDIGTPSDSTVTNAKTNFVSTSGSAGLQIKGDGTTDGTLQLNCSQNSHGIKLKSPPHSASASYTLTFPNDDGASGEALTTDGSGVLTWASAGETNTPMFFVSGGNQTISHNSNTKMTISSEAFDTDNCFDLAGTKRFVPNKAGKYFFTLNLFSPSLDDIDYWTANVKKNGGSGGGFSGVQRNYNNVCYNGILTANGTGDYFEAYCEQESGSNRTIAVSEFSAFYIGN